MYEMYNTKCSNTMFPKMKLWGTATVGTKGQVVIPAEARTQLGLKEGDKIIVMGRSSTDGLMLIKAESIEAMMQHAESDMKEIRESAENSSGESV